MKVIFTIYSLYSIYIVQLIIIPFQTQEQSDKSESDDIFQKQIDHDQNIQQKTQQLSQVNYQQHKSSAQERKEQFDENAPQNQLQPAKQESEPQSHTFIQKSELFDIKINQQAQSENKELFIDNIQSIAKSEHEYELQTHINQQQNTNDTLLQQSNANSQQQQQLSLYQQQFTQEPLENNQQHPINSESQNLTKQKSDPSNCLNQFQENVNNKLQQQNIQQSHQNYQQPFDNSPIDLQFYVNNQESPKRFENEPLPVLIQQLKLSHEQLLIEKQTTQQLKYQLSVLENKQQNTLQLLENRIETISSQNALQELNQNALQTEIIQLKQINLDLKEKLLIQQEQINQHQFNNYTNQNCQLNCQNNSQQQNQQQAPKYVKPSRKHSSQSNIVQINKNEQENPIVSPAKRVKPTKHKNEGIDDTQILTVKQIHQHKQSAPNLRFCSLKQLTDQLSADFDAYVENQTCIQQKDHVLHTELVFSNATLFQYADNSSVLIIPPHTKNVIYNNGNLMKLTESESIFYEHSSGTITTTYQEDGQLIKYKQFADGRIEKINSDGSKIVFNVEGDVKYFDKEGNEVTDQCEIGILELGHV
ncbi:TCP-10 [Hexamita inflata]|uniref:TCP-10 n=1 Tax=Hexamita inflata TaxID=28002 RepID=A0AA86UTD3_9EUKA|nr:TCP-10 [Hexamita inflata]